MSDERIELKTKFPDMTPVKSAPSMFTVNGCGLKIYGRRDEDRETNTYVISRCICAVFIPVLWLDAYRVQPAGANTYYFIGRHPLSSFCKLWNMLVISTVCVLGGYGYWLEHTRSPEYIAKRHMEDAKALRTQGKYPECLIKLSTVMATKTKMTSVAQAEFDSLIEERFDTADMKEATTLLQMASTHRLQRGTQQSADWYKRAVARAKAFAATDAQSGRRLLALAHGLASEKEKDEHSALSNELLEKAFSQNPGDLNLLSEWAAVVEQKNDPEALKKLLEPHKAKLGITEAARMLGQIYAHEGDIEASYLLLEPYTTGRLEALHEAEQRYVEQTTKASDNALAKLKRGEAGDVWYRRYDSVGEAEKRDMVDKYISDAIRGNSAVKAAEKKFTAEARIVPVALDFGIVRLQRARGLSDAAAKKRELESAEKVFLAIRGAAGESDAYMLYFGQVLFWLDRQEEGKKQFEQLLEKNNRDPQLLLTLSGVYRELGDHTASGKLAEECFSNAKDERVKKSAASARAIVAKSAEEKILWLGRADTNEAHVRSLLAEAQADLAMREGNKPAAIAKYREAIRIYESLPRNETTLNNTSVRYLSLFGATGDRADFRKGVEMQLEALALKPQDPILMLNTANSLITNAMLEILGPQVDYTRAGSLPTVNHRTHLFADEASRGKVVQRIAGNKDIQQAVSILERLLLLSPRSASSYDMLSGIYTATDNDAGMKVLRDRLRTVTLDLEESREDALDMLKNGIKPEHAKAMKARNEKLESNLKEVSTGGDPLTHALALDQMSAQIWGLYMTGEIKDFERFVNLAEVEHKVLPSSNSINGLLTSYQVRATPRIAALRPEWKQRIDQTQRLIAPSRVLPYFVEVAGELRPKILADADIQKSLALIREYHKTFPKHPQIEHWKLVQHLDSELAADIGKALLKDESAQIRCEVEYMLAPYSASMALEMVWFHQLRGDAAAAEKVKTEFTARGMPWPLP